MCMIVLCECIETECCLWLRRETGDQCSERKEKEEIQGKVWAGEVKKKTE